MLKVIPRDYFDPAKGTLKLLWEEEWRGLGITQVGQLVHNSQGWPLTDPDHRAWAGNTMKSTNQSHIFFSSSEAAQSLYTLLLY
jgi:hypothetical protein